MSDMISRSALKKDLLKRGFFPVIVKVALENAPAVDAVEVVRCKDCKHYLKAMMFCEHPEGLEVPDKMDFCSHGERRGDDGK